jgi:plastocyanin
MFIPFIGLILASTVSAKVIDIQVSSDNATLAFSPEAVFADPGDQVVYHFNPKNHTVTQSSFAGPCSPKAGGFDSGFHPVTSDVAMADRPTFTVLVNDTQPIWVFCNQAANTPNSHCGAGMVHAINCGADGSANSFTNFKNAALAIGAQLKAQNSSGSPGYGYGYGTSTATSPSPTTTPASAGGNTIEVIVGGPNGNLTFTPSRVSAAPNDIVKFTFHVKNHTVTQSSFSAPCMPLTSNTTGTRIGFNSGFMPVAANATDFPTYSITVNDTTPIWAYCAQANHCGSGMVFAINSDESSGRNFAAFQALAKELNGTTSSNSTGSSNGTTTNSGNTNTGGAIPNSVGGGLVIALIAALVGSLL